MNFEMDDLMQMSISEHRKTMAFELLKELIKTHKDKFNHTEMRILVTMAIMMTDDFLKKIEE